MSVALQIFPYIPPSLRSLLTPLTPVEWQGLEEIRLNLNLPISCRFHDNEAFIASAGGLTDESRQAHILNKKEMEQCLLLLSQSSFYALEEELRRGYITLPGGHRAGLCGRAVLTAGQVRTLKEISAVNLRLARQVNDVSLSLLPALFDKYHNLCSTLLVSPPRAGKTTLLRDIARQLAAGSLTEPLRVGIVDERSEIAAMRGGVSQLDLGIRCDILDGCPKAEGLMMLLRSMSPQVLICDEIGSEADAAALIEAANAGVKVVASAHAAACEELADRPVFAGLLQAQAFQRLVVLSRRCGPGTVEGIYDQNLQLLAAGG